MKNKIGKNAYMSNQLQKPFSDIIGEKSPVQKMLKLAWHFAEAKPETVANTIESKSASALILTHLLGLMTSVGMINCRGLHSSAITLLRAIEDATDCFAAVGINGNAAIKWNKGKLKSSDAAKIWTFDSNSDNANSSEYRKMIRTSLNAYSHCTPEQANWNIYLETIAENKCKMQLNTTPMVININAYFIDRYLCIHTFELSEVVKTVYSKYIRENSDLEKQINDLQKNIEEIIFEFLKFIGKEKLDIMTAPELLRIKR